MRMKTNVGKKLVKQLNHADGLTRKERRTDKKNVILCDLRCYYTYQCDMTHPPFLLLLLPTISQLLFEISFKRDNE